MKLQFYYMKLLDDSSFKRNYAKSTESELLTSKIVLYCFVRQQEAQTANITQLGYVSS